MASPRRNDHDEVVLPGHAVPPTDGAKSPGWGLVQYQGSTTGSASSGWARSPQLIGQARGRSRFRCRAATTTTPCFSPDLTTPHRGGPRGPRQSSTSVLGWRATTLGGRRGRHRAEPLGRRNVQGGSNDYSYHQARDLLPPHGRDCRGDGIRLVRARVPHPPDVGRASTRPLPHSRCAQARSGRRPPGR